MVVPLLQGLGVRHDDNIIHDQSIIWKSSDVLCIVNAESHRELSTLPQHSPQSSKMPSTSKNTGSVRHEPAPNPVQYETSVYQNGLRYESPPFTFHSNQWEPEAAKAMSANSAGYAIGNAGSGETARKNVDAFKRWSIVPKRLVKSEELPDLGTRVLGEEFQFPIAAGPVGVLRELDSSWQLSRWMILTG
jgi:hypothetical protein